MANKRLIELLQRNTPAKTDIAYIVETVSGDDFKMSLDDIARFTNQLSDYADKTYSVDVNTSFSAFTHRSVLILVDTSASAKNITIPTAGNNQHCQIVICAVGTNVINLTINSASVVVAGNSCALYQYNGTTWFDIRDAKKLNGAVESETAVASTIVKRTSDNKINTVDLDVTGLAEVESGNFQSLTLNGTPIAAKNLQVDIDENLTLPAISNDLELFFTPTNNRVLDITAGATVEGASVFVSNQNSGSYTVTVLYNTSAFILPANTFFMLKSNGSIFYPLFSSEKSIVGKLYFGIDTDYPENVLPFNGAIKVRALYPELWSKVHAGSLGAVVTDANWLDPLQLASAKFSSGDGSTTFRVPDWQGIFMRFTGANSILKTANGSAYNGGEILSILLDMFHAHEHTNIGGGGVQGHGSYLPHVATLTSSNSTAIVEKATYGPPRYGNQTAPVSVSINVGIYYKN